jgi:hypothetical protein
MNKADELVMMEVQCFLTEEEKIDRGRDLASHVRMVELLTSEKKEKVAAYKTKIDAHHLDAVHLSAALQNGYEYRSVECRRVMNYQLRIVDFVRVDTGELVLSRPMDIGEAQESMFDDERGKGDRHKGKITLLGK